MKYIFTKLLQILIFSFIYISSYCSLSASVPLIASVESNIDIIPETEINTNPQNTEDNLKTNQKKDSETDDEIGKAMGAFGLLDKNNSYADYINPNELTELPLGIRENKSNVEYGIVVTKAKFTPEYALINIYARVVTPQQGMDGGKKELYFGAEGVKLSYSGKIIGEAKLSLLGNILIPFNNNNWLLTLEGGKINKLNGGDSYNDNTFVIIDCYGIKELSLKGNVQISRNILLPLDQNGKILPEETVINGTPLKNRVRGDFALKATDWNDLLVKVNISPFAITSQAQKQDKGYFSFFVNNAILDMSDLRTDASVKFPEYYFTHGYLIDGAESWRGLYVESLYVGLPEEFKTKDKKNAPVSFSAENLIIDSYGVSGRFAAQNVFPLEKGTTGSENGWAYSLDKIEVDLAASKITGAGIWGKIQLPIQKQDTTKCLGYRGSITEEEYLLSVTTLDNIDFSLWKAKATIAAGSSVEMRVQNKQFYPRAILNGKLDISAGDQDEADTEAEESKTVRFKEIRFEGLALQTQAPYFTVKSFGAMGEQKLANFPASISNIILTSDGYQASLSFGISVGLQDNGFAASGILHVNGEMVSNNSTQDWKYKGFQLSKLALDNVDIGIANVSGSLEIMKKDPLYGNGFKAFLSAKLNAMNNVTVSVNAVYGYSTFRYWGFEGSVNGLKIPAGYVQITGFTGGAFYHMIPDRDMSLLPEYKDKALVLTPDKTIGLALRAGVYGNLYDDGIASFMAGFNMSTNANGGLANIGFVGEAFIMEDITAVLPDPFAGVKDKFKDIVGQSNFLKDLKDNKRVNSFLDVEQVDNNYPTTATTIKSAMYAKLAMNYDFNNKIFHANLDVYVNVANGMIKGVGSGGRAGWAVLHIAPKDWYMYIGTPTDMIGLRVGLKNFYVESSSYFMVGSTIPDSPAPPIEVARILGLELNDIDYMKSLNSLADGKGFAFGTHFKFDTGDMTALFLYARFQAGLGGDIMLRNYGEASCSNRAGEQIGINGWYANGQAYVYLQGELGIKIKLFFIKKKIPIIKAGAAALLQAKAPNPVWMRGYLGGYYNLLGGMIKGKFRFKLEFGEECQLENESILGGMKIITDLTPKKDDNDVDVFAIPQATFAFNVNEPFVIPEDDADHTYKIVIDKFTVTDEAGAEIDGKIEYTKSGDIANFVSDDILPPHKKMKAVLQVSFMEKKGGLYEVLTDKGQKAIETEERWFTTGTAPNVIPLSNIQYAYPVVNQENYYIKESNAGYIKLKRGQDYLFDDPNWKSQSQLKDAGGNPKVSDFRYDGANNEVLFTVPALDKQKEYTLSIIAKNANSGNKANNNTVTTTTVRSEGADENSSMTTETATKTAANLSKDGEIERLSFVFKTSRYNTLSDKIDKLNFNPLWMKVTSDVVSLQNNMNADEYFDATELIGSQYTDNKPLISLTAYMDDPFAGKFNALIYDKYPLDGLTLDRIVMQDNVIGVPPVNALPIFSSYLLYLDKEKGNQLLKNTFPYYYDLFRYYKADWYESISKAAAKYVNTPTTNRPEEINTLMSSQYNVAPKMKYKVKVQYQMPGDKSGSHKEINYQYK